MRPFNPSSVPCAVASAIICPGLLEIQPFGVRNVCGTGNVRVFKRVLAPRAPFICKGNLSFGQILFRI